MSGSSIYNVSSSFLPHEVHFLTESQHRTLQPSGPSSVSAGPQHSITRLNDSFDAIRNEFEVMVNEVGVARSQRDDFESKGMF